MDIENILFTYVPAFIIACFVLYVIIKAAVRSANAETESLLRILVNMGAEEMKKNGLAADEISSLIKTS